jgi:hypothetical protein
LKRSSLIETLIAHEYDDLVGAIEINVAEALLRIAAAIERLAAAQEASMLQHTIENADIVPKDNDDGGHA